MSKKAIWWIMGIVIAIIVVAAIWWGAGTAKAPEVNSNTPAATETTPGVTNASGTATSSVSGGASSTTGTATSANGGGTYKGSSYSFDYPSGWTIESYKPFIVTNFGGKYVDNNVIPEGGAELGIATTTVYGNLQSIMQTELMNATNISTSAVTVNGTACARANYNSTYGGSVATKATAVYCERGNELWKIYFSYRADDPAASAHVAAFTSMLASMKLL